MRRSWVIVAIAAILVLVMECSGQSAQPQGNISVPNRTVVPALLETSVEATAGSVGKGIELVSTEDIRDANGRVLVPKRAKLLGHVTLAVPWTKDQPESRLSILVDSAKWKGHSVVLRAFVAGDLKILTSGKHGTESSTMSVTELKNVPVGRPLPIPSSIGSEIYPDKTVEVRIASSAAIVSELVSKDHTVRLEQGSTFSLRQLAQ